MLVSVHLQRLAREYNVRVSSDKPKHDNFCQSRQKKRSKHAPNASVIPYSTSQPIHPFSYATSITLSLSLISVPPMTTTTWLIAEEQLVSCQLTGSTLPQMNQLIYRQRQAISVQNVHRQRYNHLSLSAPWYPPCKSRDLLLLWNALFEEEIHLLQWISR